MSKRQQRLCRREKKRWAEIRSRPLRNLFRGLVHRDALARLKEVLTDVECDRIEPDGDTGGVG